MEDTEIRQTLRLPGKLLERLRAAAERDHRSVHGQILSYIEKGLAADDRRDKRAATMEARS